MTRKNKMFYNGSGYPDPTAFYGTKKIVQEEAAIEKKVHTLVNVIRDIANLAGFDVVGRIHLKHRKTGKEFK